MIDAIVNLEKNRICYSVSASRYDMTGLRFDSQVLMVSPLHGS